MAIARTAFLFAMSLGLLGCGPSEVDWRALAENRYDPGTELAFGPPATAADWKQTEEQGVDEWPAEFIDLYNEFNGFGIGPADDRWWLLMPLDRIADFTNGVRDWFRETHPDQVYRFLAFIDWGNGDATGYLYTPEGEQLEGLYTFNHEFYEFETSQNWEEFLLREYDSLEEFLRE